MKYKEKCPDCNATIEVYVDQSITPYEFDLVWSKTLNCSNCNSITEIDDRGALPKDIRKMILMQDGYWLMTISHPIIQKEKKSIIKILKNTFGFDFNRAVSKIKNCTGVIYRGTKTEVQWLNTIFEKYSISTTIKRYKDSKRIDNNILISTKDLYFSK